MYSMLLILQIVLARVLVAWSYMGLLGFLLGLLTKLVGRFVVVSIFFFITKLNFGTSVMASELFNWSV
jgi:hypothetical protein